MKRSNKKKGFTLVELIVVIAILAILATVTIVGYVSFTKKAKVSNDISLTTQINTALEADEALGKPATLTEANVVLKEMGVDLSKLSPTSDDYSYIWNSLTNRVILLDKEKKVVCPENAEYSPLTSFAIVHNSDDVEKWSGYSLYLASDFESTDGVLNVSAGVDAGECTSVTTINYANNGAAQDVVICTNGGTLTINAANDTVKHYGNANVVDISKVAPTSYYENGCATFVKIAQGRFVVETTAKVGEIFVPTTTQEVIVATRSGAKLPNISAQEDNKTVKIQTLPANSNEAQSTADSEVLPKKDETTAKNDSASVIVPEFDDKYVACIGWQGYETLIGAIKAVEEGGENPTVITLLKDSTGCGLAVGSKADIASFKNIIIDFNGYKYTVDGSAVGSTNTETQAMHWDDGSTIVMKNGSLVVSPEAQNVAMAMQNYSTFTAENMHFDFTSVPVSNYEGEQYGEWNGLEAPIFNSNYEANMTLSNCTIKMPETSTKGVYIDNGKLTLTNCTIDGYISIERSGASVLVDSKTTHKGVVSYFNGHNVVSDTTTNAGYTTYKLGN